MLLNADKLATNELSDEEKARRECQCIYGDGIMEYFWADDHLWFENSTRVYKALQDEGKLFQMIDSPGAKHSMCGEKVRNHLYRSLADFLDRQLKSGK